jgi:ATP-dependent Zn protease
MVSSGYETAKSVLSVNIHILHALAQALIEREELNTEGIDRIVSDWSNGHGEEDDSAAVMPDEPAAE